MKILLITPPLVQLNTPYPATQSLMSFMEKSGYDVLQLDLSIDLIERVYTKSFLAPLFEEAFQRDKLSEKAKSVAMQKQRYLDSVESVVRFLQGKDDTLSTRIANREFLPEGSRFKKVDDEMLEWSFGSTGFSDKAKHIASLYMVDLSDFIAEMTTSKFALIKYAEQISMSAKVFDYIKRDIDNPITNKIDEVMLALLHEEVEAEKPDLVGFSVPFPGTLYSALKCGAYLKEKFPNVKITIGGGYVNTELRQLSDARVFDYVDFISFDDGELPLLRISELIEGKIDKDKLVRTIFRDGDDIVQMLNVDKNVNFEDLPTPTYVGIDFTKYISLIEFTNPMHKLWSDGKWLKLTFAHGCYWGKCAFCDTSLDYIKRYDSATVERVVEKVEQMVRETSISGFHFTDEALPAKLLIDFARRIIEKGLIISFWGNIRFDKTFTKENCEILSKAGCVAVSGGLEVASARVLKLINKGISVETAVEVAYNFTSNGIMVHTYLMYGFPTQTMQECIDSLDIVRQMFESGLIQSGFWHRFALTVHSPVACEADKFNIEYDSDVVNPFANNAVAYREDTDIDFNRVNKALKGAMYNYMQGMGYDIPLKNWFENKEAVPTLKKNYVSKIVERLLNS